jgi:hypothetical protein
MQINGAWHRGAVSFTADIDPSRVVLCRCTDCQIMSGSALRMVVLASIDKFAVSGRTKGYVKVAESGNRRMQVFCPECGTPPYATTPEHATTVSIRLGCVKERAELRPAAQLWARSAMPWLHELADPPASAGQQALLTPSAPQLAVQRAS